MCQINEDLEFRNKISKICLQHFEELPKTGKPKENEWTILSCIVMQKSEVFEVVALGTGSKCIGHQKMSPNGDILNDSHAEVICRKAFLRFLHENILSSRSAESVFKFNESTQKFSLKDSAKFHFFTTHVPCGDAAIFPKQSDEDFGEILAQETVSDPKKIKLDSFRTGAKCLTASSRQDLKLGDKYHVTGVVRTKPGRGDPTLSVSCSDKLARWCHLGLQGALLSILIEKPIYLSTFTIAGEVPFSESALKRALYDRLGDVNFCDASSGFYKRHMVVVGQSNLSFNFKKRDDRSPSASSIIWLKSKQSKQLEVAVEGRRQGITKKQQNSSVGRLTISKVELFQSFLYIVEEFQTQISINDEDVKLLTYKEAKLLAKNYQKAWQSLKKSFKEWTSKDEKLLQFTCTSTKIDKKKRPSLKMP